MKLTPEELAKAIARRKEYDRLRMKAKRLAEKQARPPKPEKPLKVVKELKPRPAPAYHRWSPETEAVNPNNVPVTRLPTPPARFHVEAPSDGFAAEWRRLRA